MVAGALRPDRGHAIWLNFDPQAGHEQAGRRPAVVMSPEAYNAKVGLALLWPVTSQAKGYPFEVALPAGLLVSGVILSDQAKSLDWRIRDARFICALPAEVVTEALLKLSTLIGR